MGGDLPRHRPVQRQGSPQTEVRVLSRGSKVMCGTAGAKGLNIMHLVVRTEQAYYWLNSVSYILK